MKLLSLVIKSGLGLILPLRYLAIQLIYLFKHSVHLLLLSLFQRCISKVIE